jgi:hypothetical protein
MLMPPIDNTNHGRLERSVLELDLAALVAERRNADPTQPYYPSPTSWAEQVLYFVLVDRFSDGDEQGSAPDPAGGARPTYLDNDGHPVAGGATPLFRYPTDASTADLAAWSAARRGYCCGTQRGLCGKLGYIKRLGATAVWVSPVLKQVAHTFDEQSNTPVPANNYHGYATQNFLDVEPSFGTRQDLRDLVTEAHRIGLRVILDIVVNHAGDVFQYRYHPDRYPPLDGDGQPMREHTGHQVMDPRWDGGPYAVQGYRDASGAAPLPFDTIDPVSFPHVWPDGAIWPVELQPASTFHRRGASATTITSPRRATGTSCAIGTSTTACSRITATTSRCSTPSRRALPSRPW